MKHARGMIWIALLAMTACGTAPPIPDFTYYRLPVAQHGEPLARPLFKEPLVVDALAADGLYADKALIYALDPDAIELRQYHYQLWTDPPTRLLQRRLIARLRASQMAPLVVDSLPASEDAVRIGGVILRFDRLPTAAGEFIVAVTLNLRADGPGGKPLVDETYRARKPAQGPTLKATVDAFGDAIDEILGRFEADLKEHGDLAHAR